MIFRISSKDIALLLTAASSYYFYNLYSKHKPYSFDDIRSGKVSLSEVQKGIEKNKEISHNYKKAIIQKGFDKTKKRYILGKEIHCRFVQGSIFHNIPVLKVQNNNISYSEALNIYNGCYTKEDVIELFKHIKRNKETDY